jgi:hypothetical protein
MSKEIEEIQQEFRDQQLLYSPNSIWHGMPLKGMTPETMLKQELERMRDFVEYLFEHSEHCNHISQSEAWAEFEVYEVNP